MGREVWACGVWCGPCDLANRIHLHGCMVEDSWYEPSPTFDVHSPLGWPGASPQLRRGTDPLPLNHPSTHPGPWKHRNGAQPGLELTLARVQWMATNATRFQPPTGLTNGWTSSRVKMLKALKAKVLKTQLSSTEAV